MLSKFLAPARANAILARCDDLARITEEPGRITRSYLSPAMERANALVSSWMHELGMDVERDHAGNLIGSLSGESPDGEDRPLLVFGSHLDTVRNAGRYDGILGVLLSLAAVESCLGTPLPFDLEVVAFADEEGLRFGVPFLGSRAMVGPLAGSILERRDLCGVSVSEAIREWGGEPGAITCRYAGRRLLGFVEPHIEQGPVLESRDLPLGVLSSIYGSRWLRLRFRGQTGHAGTTPMDQRQDALAGAAEWIVEAERIGQAEPGLVVTVGKLEVSPGAGNVIPGAVELSLDVRHDKGAVLDRAVGTLLARARQIGDRRDLTLAHETLNHGTGIRASEELSRILGQAVAEATGDEPPRLGIGAGHDAMIMAQIMPVAMLMIRSPGGISHHPDEAVLPADVEAAIESLERFTERLADGDWRRLAVPESNRAGKSLPDKAESGLETSGAEEIP